MIASKALASADIWEQLRCVSAGWITGTCGVEVHADVSIPAIATKISPRMTATPKIVSVILP
jgi:hypothetical protein